MKRSIAAACAAALVLTTIALAGCTSWFESPAKPVNNAIAGANDHLKKAAALESEASSGTAGLQALPYTSKGAAQALTIIGSVKSTLTQERAELVTAKSSMDSIAAMEVSAPFKQYAKLESAAIDARIALVDANSRLYEGMGRLYGSLAKSGTTADTPDMITAIQQMQHEVTALADTAAQAAKTAADYFTSNKLGG